MSVSDLPPDSAPASAATQHNHGVRPARAGGSPRAGRISNGPRAIRQRLNVVAVDLGAESGRVMLGQFDGRQLTLTEAHRFPNGARAVDGLLRWDLTTLWEQIRIGMAKAATLLPTGEEIVSVGVDTWGLDYGLLDADGQLINDPVSYRDPRTRGMLAEAVRLVGRRRLYAETGIQLMEVNTIYQLLAEVRAGGADLQKARTLLLIPDLFHHLLSGQAVAEYTEASTTGAYDVANRRWATGLLSDLGIPTEMLPEVVEAGTDLGLLLPPLREELGVAYGRTRVITPGSHDTASAVVSVPFTDPAAAYISSGTWSLVGVETDQPVLTEAARLANLTNEGGVLGTIRLLRNCMGLWILQECRRQWEREGKRYTYQELVDLASAAPGGVSVINPDHPDFVTPGDMPERIRQYCRRTGQPVPINVAAIARCVLDSLALRYRMAFTDLGEVTGRPVSRIHIVGGGSRNTLLNQLTADAAGLEVVGGPVEATAMGNVLMQLHALGEVSGLEQMREVVRTSAHPHTVTPTDPGRFTDLYGRFTEWVAADLAEAGITDKTD